MLTVPVPGNHSRHVEPRATLARAASQRTRLSEESLAGEATVEEGVAVRLWGAVFEGAGAVGLQVGGAEEEGLSALGYEFEGEGGRGGEREGKRVEG